ncbi:core component of ECF transporter [Shewanella sp. Scap07]|uniref:core component of ECF transporter n=1 Tax=Shewanella sp. Scap07 TaxID=2589987 RepID=UPI0015BC2641|nr:core component of ECF transporter [Shewanella sp. Scap07]QLE87496.1 core component of ECF transporter [Shewanella sp. Scap07]
MFDKKLQLQDALFIGFCATLLVALKSMLRLKLGLTGHSMFLMCFFYLVCYGGVGRCGAITLCGVLAGVVAMILGVGKGGPLILAKFALPAVAMDITLMLLPSVMPLLWRFIALALAATLAWALKGFVGDLLVGLSVEVSLLKGAKSLFFGSLFAIAAALLVPSVLQRLKSHDLLHKDEV